MGNKQSNGGGGKLGSKPSNTSRISRDGVINSSKAERKETDTKMFEIKIPKFKRKIQGNGKVLGDSSGKPIMLTINCTKCNQGLQFPPGYSKLRCSNCKKVMKIKKMRQTQNKKSAPNAADLRAKRLNAAEQRAGEWDRKVAKAKALNKAKEDDDVDDMDCFEAPFASEEDLMAARLESERRAAENGGFDPFRAVISSSVQARGTIIGGAAGGGEKNMSSATKPAIVEEDIWAEGCPVCGLKSIAFEFRSQHVSECLDATMLADAVDTSMKIDECEMMSEEEKVKIQLLKNVLAQDEGETALNTILKLINNPLNNPTEIKYRRVNLTKPAIKKRIVDVLGSVDVLRVAGFVDGYTEEGDVCLSLSLGAELASKEINQLTIAAKYLKQVLN